MTFTAFDRIAAEYDSRWTQSAIGRAQRDAVWRWLDRLIRPGHCILDLGCGTGEDALHLMKAGAEVCGIDSSGEMVRIARERGVNARRLPIEALSEIADIFDGAISNFGALNCARELRRISVSLKPLIRPGGFLAVCLMGSFCMWETCYFLARRSIRAAFRRRKRQGACSTIGVHVTYPSIAQLKAAFSPAFQLSHWTGIGVCVPPSYVNGLSTSTVQRLSKIDLRIAHWPVLRSVADHRLLFFTRV